MYFQQHQFVPFITQLFVHDSLAPFFSGFERDRCVAARSWDAEFMVSKSRCLNFHKIVIVSVSDITPKDFRVPLTA